MASAKLQRQIRAQLKLFLGHNLPLSILVLHISQLEMPGLLSHTAPLPQRQRYHASSRQVEQVIHQMRRTMRASDTDIVKDEAGAAIILPGVEQMGALNILERVYQSIGLLQAKTIIPPLQHETEISIGIVTYPNSGISLEDLLRNNSLNARQIVLRPEIYPQDWLQLTQLPETEKLQKISDETSSKPQSGIHKPIPFMHLPASLPAHLAHLIPYKLAKRLKCVPVGFEKDNLTVAMVNPTNAQVIQTLHKKTNMHIFPVACNRTELQTLLTQGW